MSQDICELPAVQKQTGISFSEPLFQNKMSKKIRETSEDDKKKSSRDPFSFTF